MKTNIYIPKKIKVGSQKRNDTYTQKLAYVIYYDHKNILRKEKSWESWRHKDIEPIDFDNVPTSGFVLNKKVGGNNRSSWNPRATYVRVYDPRDFEFEISIPNLLYILENGNSIKGKGLEGEFVYAWDGTELVLMPVAAPEYAEITEFNSVVQTNSFIKAKDLIVGGTYKTNKDKDVVYMGKFDYHPRGYYYEESAGVHYWFQSVEGGERWDKKIYFEHTQMKSVSGRIVKCIDDKCCLDFPERFERMESSECYSPYDRSKDTRVHFTKETLIEELVYQTGHYDRETSVRLISEYAGNVPNYNNCYGGNISSYFNKNNPDVIKTIKYGRGTWGNTTR